MKNLELFGAKACLCHIFVICFPCYMLYRRNFPASRPPFRLPPSPGRQHRQDTLRGKCHLR